MPPPADLSPEAHAKLDRDFRSNASGLSLETHAALILFVVLVDSVKAYETVWPIDMPKITTCQTRVLGKEIRTLLESSHSTGDYSEIRKRPEFHKKVDKPLNEPSPHFQSLFEAF